MKKKPASAKSVAAKAKREKMTVNEPLADAVRQRLEDSYERSYGDPALDDSDDIPWSEDITRPSMVTYPSTAPLEQADFLSASEAAAAEEQLLGKRGVPHHSTCPVEYANAPKSDCNCVGLNDPMPEFLQNAAKAGPPKEPPLDALGRKILKRADAIALGETANLPTIVVDNTIRRTVTILRDHDLDYPDLYMAVFVVPDWHVPDDEARFARLFARSGCYRADTIEEADLVVFGGGSDVEPLLYGESNEDMHPSVYFNKERDAADIQVYLKARNQGTPMMGVCRGAQFLHVMNGGKLYQDIDGHNGGHKAFALREKLLIESVSSVHHQSCMLNTEGGMEILLTTSNSSKVRWLNKDEKDAKPKIDIEAFYYRDSGCFGVQGHPEYQGYSKFSTWCLEQVSNLFLTSPDFTWEGKRLQMTKEARDAKEIAKQYVEQAYNQSQEA